MDISEDDKNMMIELIEDFRFMSHNGLNFNLKKDHEREDKLNLIRRLKLKKVKAGTRIFAEDEKNIECAHLILRGKTAVLYVEKELYMHIKCGLVEENTVVLNKK